MGRPSSTSSSEQAPGRQGWPAGALVALCLLALAEGATRLAFQPAVVGSELYDAHYPAYDYGFAGTPVCFRVDEKLSCAPTPYLGVPRRRMPFAKARGEKRIFTIGASVSRGDRKGSYSTELEKLLRARNPGKKLRVVNLSAKGIGSTRQLLLWREALRYEPDLLLLHVHGSNEWEDDRDLAYSEELHRGLGGLALHSRLVVVLKKLFAEETGLAAPQKPAVEMPGERKAGKDPATRQRWLTTIDANVATMLTLAARARVPVILVGRAERRPPSWSSADGDDVNALLAARAGPTVRWFDTAAALRELTQDEVEPFFRDQVHFAAPGRQAVAERLAPLCEAELFPPVAR